MDGPQLARNLYDTLISQKGEGKAHACEMAFVNEVIQCSSMLSFNVSLNGKKLCLAGIDKRGVLSVILTWAASDQGEEVFLHAGGLANEEYIDWIDHARLQVGDEIRVQICEVESVDDPSRKRSRDSAETLDRKKQYVHRIAKELGWRIQTDPDNPDDPSAQ